VISKISKEAELDVPEPETEEGEIRIDK